MDLPTALALVVAALVGVGVGLAFGRAPARGGSAALLTTGPAPLSTEVSTVPVATGPAPAGNRDLDVLVELVGIGVVRLAPDLVVRSANETAARLLGRRTGSLDGRSAMEAFTDHRIEEIARTALETGAATGEVVVRTSDAPTLLVRARRTDGGDAWVAFEDVTELRRLQRIRTEFVDNLSHELRTPLTTISLLAETLGRDAEQLPAKTAERIGLIEVETGHLVQMVNELLDLSRIESGSATLVVEEVDLGRIAAQTAARLALFSERQGVRIETEAPAAGPNVRGDPDRLGQAILNLLHNAVKFSPSGAAVTLRVAAAESEAIVEVEDRGPGIPRAAQARVFERFYKVDRARTRAHGGTGLGLAIARHIVEGHGGRIWLESDEGQGSTFTFAIPLAGPEIAATAGA